VTRVQGFGKVYTLHPVHFEYCLFFTRAPSQRNNSHALQKFKTTSWLALHFSDYLANIVHHFAYDC